MDSVGTGLKLADKEQRMTLHQSSVAQSRKTQ